jgi:hypothetical protein
MPVPLDRIVHLLLSPGQHVIEAMGRQGRLRETVVVACSTHRAFPTTEIHVHEPLAHGGAMRIELVGTPGDGFVARLEWRGFPPPGPCGMQSPRWQEALPAEREGALLRAWLEVRPEEIRRIEARAIDGQGSTEPRPAVANLNLQP